MPLNPTGENSSLNYIKKDELKIVIDEIKFMKKDMDKLVSKNEFNARLNMINSDINIRC